MIRLFFKLCKCYKQISFENEINYFDKHMKSIKIDTLICPFCGARHTFSPFASYTRNFVTYEDCEVHNNTLVISRYICSSCGHTHAILPSVIVPYTSFSFKFIVYLLHSYLVHEFKSVEAMCDHYCISISTFYRILSNFKVHKKLWIGLLSDKLISNLAFLQHLMNIPFIEIESFISDFFSTSGFSFFQGTS